MMAYGQLYGCERLTLLYPHHVALGQLDGVSARHRINGSNDVLEMATIDVAVAYALPARLSNIVLNRSDFLQPRQLPPAFDQPATLEPMDATDQHLGL